MCRSRKMLENQLNLGSDRTETLETQLKEARTLAAESDRKFDEVSCCENRVNSSSWSSI